MNQLAICLFGLVFLTIQHTHTEQKKQSKKQLTHANPHYAIIIL